MEFGLIYDEAHEVLTILEFLVNFKSISIFN